jgi:hypothetical protein
VDATATWAAKAICSEGLVGNFLSGEALAAANGIDRCTMPNPGQRQLIGRRFWADVVA